MTQIYNVFLIRNDSTPFLFSFRQEPQLKPQVGDVLTNPLTFVQFKILRDEVAIEDITIFRITAENDQRVTENDDLRITQEGIDLDTVTHNYFVTPANNPQRIASWSTAGFANDKTLQQLFH